MIYSRIRKIQLQLLDSRFASLQMPFRQRADSKIKVFRRDGRIMRIKRIQEQFHVNIINVLEEALDSIFVSAFMEKNEFGMGCCDETRYELFVEFVHDFHPHIVVRPHGFMNNIKSRV